MIDRPDNINIFILYAKEDEALKQELEDHLGLLQRLGYIDVWHEGQVQAGVEKEQVVAAYLEKAHIILLLISANFLAPDNYTKYEAELRVAYERQKHGEVNIIPVILRHCVWQLDMLAGLNPLPSGGFPVRSDHWESVDKAFHDITTALQRVATEIKSKTAAEVIRGEQALKQMPDSPEIALSAAVPPVVPLMSAQIQSGSSPDIVLNDLFDALFTHPVEEALKLFMLIAHRSLLRKGKLEPYFRKNNFDVAYARARQYKRPVEMTGSKPTGRRKIGPRNDKDEGEEDAYTLARIKETGGMPGQVRIFRSALDNSLKISGLSL